MRPSNILIRKLHNLVSDTNLWMVPEYRDNKKKDTTMKVAIAITGLNKQEGSKHYGNT